MGILATSDVTRPKGGISCHNIKKIRSIVRDKSLELVDPYGPRAELPPVPTGKRRGAAVERLADASRCDGAIYEYRSAYRDAGSLRWRADGGPSAESAEKRAMASVKKRGHRRRRAPAKATGELRRQTHAGATCPRYGSLSE